MYLASIIDEDWGKYSKTLLGKGVVRSESERCHAILATLRRSSGQALRPLRLGSGQVGSGQVKVISVPG